MEGSGPASSYARGPGGERLGVSGAAARAISSFASLPDFAHRNIAAHLRTPDQLQVAVTASSMLSAYGCHLARLRFGVDAPPEGLQHMVGLLGRQEALEELHITAKQLFPALLPIIVDGVGQRLKKLQLGVWRDMWSDFIAEDVEVPLALFQGLPTVLPALEKLRLYQRWPEELDQEALWVEFAQGSLPRLRALTIYPEMENMDADTQDAALEMLAMALESREASGCAGLAELHLVNFNWMLSGSIDARRRLWRVLLPTLEKLPGYYGVEEVPQEMVDAIVQYGAPCLRYLSVTRPQISRCLPCLTGLEDLVLRRADVPLMKSFARASLQCADLQQFLPRLRRLYIYERCWRRPARLIAEEESEEESEDEWVDENEEEELRQLRRLGLPSFFPMRRRRRRRIEYHSDSDSEDTSDDEDVGTARAFPSLEIFSQGYEKIY